MDDALPLESAASLFVALSPLPPSIAELLYWRRRQADQREPVLPPGAIATGAGAPEDRLTSLAADVAWDSAIETAFVRTRRNPGFLLRLHDAEAALTARVAACAAPGESHAARIWLLTSTELGPCLIAGCAFAQSTPLQPAVADAIVAALTGERERGLIDTAIHAAFDGFPAATTFAIREDATHLVAFYRRADDRYRAIHLAQEANETDESADYDSAGTLRYAHVGWSYTTFVADAFATPIFLLPVCAIAQMSWAIQRAFEAALRKRDWEQTRSKAAGSAERLSQFERLKLELRMLRFVRQDFFEALRPWQQRLYTRFIAYWSLETALTTLDDVSHQVSAYLNARVAVQKAASDARQARYLNIISVFAILGLASTVASYNDLLGDVDPVKNLHHAFPYIAFVGVLFAVTLAFTVSGIATVIFGTKDAGRGSDDQ